jgi:3-oxoacyl-[acyl-carrier-protein] synthase-3
MKQHIGILGVGAYLPPDVRRNDEWPEHVVAGWREKAARRLERIRAEFEKETSIGSKMTMDAIAALAGDPFQGGRERRIMPAGMSAADMETTAAREAISKAGIDADEIDLVMSYTMCPDFINVPTACVVHGNLGLRERCTTLALDAVCNSFMMQISLAQAMIASGRARYALLTQSSAVTRLPSSGELHDNWFGDAGTAIVLGPVSEGRGVLSYSHHTDGKLWGAFVCGVPDGHWSDGKCVAYSTDHAAHLDMLVRITDRAKQVLGESLADAGIRPEDVDFYACHQAFHWLRRVTQQHAGLTKARAVDHFDWTGTVSAANLPLQLAIASREGVLRDGHTVACFQGGTGMTWSAMALRWGT